MAICQDALADAKITVDESIGSSMACLIGSAINGTDSLREAFVRYSDIGANGVSPFLSAQRVRERARGKGGRGDGLHGADLLTPGRLRVGQPRHRLGRAHGARRRRGLRHRWRRRDAAGARDRPRLCQHERQLQAAQLGPRRPGSRTGIAPVQPRPARLRPGRGRRCRRLGCRGWS